MGHIDERLVLQVRLLPEPSLWCWEIRDRIDSQLVESGWASEWVAFASRQDAVAAGARRLAELEAAGSARGGCSPVRSGRYRTTRHSTYQLVPDRH